MKFLYSCSGLTNFIFSAVLESIEKENLLLKKKNLELQEQLIILEKSVNTLTEEKNICKFFFLTAVQLLLLTS